MMKRRKKIFITGICLFLFAIIGGVLYANYWLNNLLSSSAPWPDVKNSTQANAIDVGKADASQKASPQKDSTVSSDANKENAAQSNAENKAATQPKEKTEPTNNSQQTNTSTSPNGATPAATTPANSEIANTVQQEIGSSVATTDLFKAGFIILRKLSKDEINFLFGFSDKTYTNEELKEVRSLLLSKLSAEDIKTLRTLGAKYGKKLDILDPNVPIK